MKYVNMPFTYYTLPDYSNLTFQSKSSFKSTRLYHMVITLAIIINHADAILDQTSLMLYVIKVNFDRCLSQTFNNKHRTDNQICHHITTESYLYH